jgi:hypothetical protein
MLIIFEDEEDVLTFYSRKFVTQFSPPQSMRTKKSLLNAWGLKRVPLTAWGLKRVLPCRVLE